MKYIIDVHTHTFACHHAFSTLEENIASAYSKGIKFLCYTEHGPTMPYAPPDWFYEELAIIPKVINNTNIITGVESNIIDESGKTDIDDLPKEWFNFVIASLHKHTYLPANHDNDTQTLLNAMDNPYIDMLGHIDSPLYKLDYDAIIKKAANTNTLIEFNNGSIKGVRKGGKHNFYTMADLCMKYSCMIALGSDAHISHNVGVFDSVLEILKEVDFPDELIINNKEDIFLRTLRANNKNI
jgi:putative hydrolase